MNRQLILHCAVSKLLRRATGIALKMRHFHLVCGLEFKVPLDAIDSVIVVVASEMS